MEYDDENSHSYWFFQLLVENRKKFIKKVRSIGIPCNVVNQRIDRYKIFKNKILTKNINYFYNHHIGLPVNTDVNEKIIIGIANEIKR